jgi:hypothetical protein
VACPQRSWLIAHTFFSPSTTSTRSPTKLQSEKGLEGGTLAVQNFPFGDRSISSASRQKLFLFQGQYFLLATKHIWVLSSKREMAFSPDYDVIQKRDSHNLPGSDQPPGNRQILMRPAGDHLG